MLYKYMEDEIEKIKELFIKLKKLSQNLKMCHNQFIDEYKKSKDISVELKELIKIVKS